MLLHLMVLNKYSFITFENFRWKSLTNSSTRSSIQELSERKLLSAVLESPSKLELLVKS